MPARQNLISFLTQRRHVRPLAGVPGCLWQKWAFLTYQTALLPHLLPLVWHWGGWKRKRKISGLYKLRCRCYKKAGRLQKQNALVLHRGRRDRSPHWKHMGSRICVTTQQTPPCAKWSPACSDRGVPVPRHVYTMKSSHFQLGSSLWDVISLASIAAQSQAWFCLDLTKHTVKLKGYECHWD